MHMYKQNDDPFILIGGSHLMLTNFLMYARKILQCL